MKRKEWISSASVSGSSGLIDRRSPSSRTTNSSLASKSGANSHGKFDAIAAVRPSNRQQTIETAFAFEGLQWELTPANYGSDPDTASTGFDRIRRPWYLQGKLNQEVRGVPYCWGCHGSLANFRQRVESGTMAGNVCTRNAPRPDVAGVDCSAFVSAAWDLDLLHYGGNSGDCQAARESLGSEARRRAEQTWISRHALPSLHPGSQGRSHGIVNWRMQWTGLSQRLSARVIARRGYVPVRFRALAEDNTTVSASVYQKPDLSNNSPAGPSKRPIHQKR